jgi:tetratricopeptide (TPR) repeat protein
MVMGPPPPPAYLQAPTALDQATQALHAGKSEQARPLFEAWLSAHPQDADALVGLGFALLRLNLPEQAAPRFEAALAVAPTYVDALYGRALCHLRAQQGESAKALLRRGLGLDPKREDLKAALATALDLSPDPLPPLPPLQRPAALEMVSRTQDRHFEVRDAKGAWRPLFLKGINLGAALPGKHPSEFPDRATYDRWLQEMAEAGFNTVRVYTIHPPHFYEAFRDFNLAREAKGLPPLWMVHGVWTELPPEDDFLDAQWWGAWQAEMRRVADLLHGHANLEKRPGHSWGAYRADVSKWTLAMILGREWEPFAVTGFNAKHPGEQRFEGRFIRMAPGHATEHFMALAMETFLAYEHDTYHCQRPIAFTNWPTLDPLHHPTESTKDEEEAWRKKYGEVATKEAIREFDNDGVGLDLEKYDAGPELKAGMFASYHAYSYYPDFINLDPGYRQGRDFMGPNNYQAYLEDLVRHHRKHPVSISEFGVPSSRLVAHWQPQGMTHGGQTEQEQGEQDARQFRNVHDAGCAGGMLFAWIDEWFKKNWLVIDTYQPIEHKPRWYNAQDAEENYGLLGFRPGKDGPAITLDGKDGDWKGLPVYAQGSGLRVKLRADEGWLHVGIWSDTPFDWAKEGLVLGLDTYQAKLGNHTLPWNLGLRSEAGLEFVVHLKGPKDAALWTDAPYDLFTHRTSRPMATVDHADGPFVMPMTESNRPRIGRDGTRFEGHRQEIGWLRFGTDDRSDPAFDSRSEWRDSADHRFLELRLPWGLLNFSDPSSRRVLQDTVPPGDEYGAVVTDGLRLVVLRVASTGPLQAGEAKVVASLPAVKEGRLPAPPLFTWPTWIDPTFHGFRKRAFDLVAAGLRDVSDVPAVLPPPPPPPQEAPAPASLAVLLSQAREARDAGRFDGALAAYDAMLIQAPEHETALLERAQVLAWAGRFPEAEAAYRTFRTRHPEGALTADLRLAQLAAWQSRTDEALRRLDPWLRQGQRQAVLDGATYEAWDGRLRPALARLQDWSRLHPDDTEALALRAKFLSWADQSREAERLYRAVLQIHPEDREARLGLARLALWRDDPAGAAQALAALPPTEQAHPDARLLAAQVALAEGRLQEARTRTEALAREGRLPQDVRDLRLALADRQGPMAELSGARTDTSDRLRMEELRLRGAVPFFDGALEGWGVRREVSLGGAQARPSEVGLGLSQALPARLWVSGSAARVQDLGAEGATTWQLSLGWTPAPGVELGLNHGLEWATFTPAATVLRLSLRTTGLEAGWRPGGGLHHFGGGYAVTDLSAGSTRRAWSLSYDAKRPFSGWELRGGAQLRGFGYSETLPLGFFNPGSYRYQGLSGGASLKRGSRFELSVDLRAGRQEVNGDGQTTWGPSLAASWQPAGWTTTFFANWTKTYAGLPVTAAGDPSEYREAALRLGLRVRSLRALW